MVPPFGGIAGGRGGEGGVTWRRLGIACLLLVAVAAIGTAVTATLIGLSVLVGKTAACLIVVVGIFAGAAWFWAGELE